MAANSHRLWFLFFILSFLPGASLAGDHSLDDMSWLTGHWLDLRDPEQPVEVRWNAPTGDAMIGSWRKNDDESLVFYEILTMREIDSVIYYRFDFYEKNGETGLFSESSSTRLELLELHQNQAQFQIVGEENWKLTMEVENNVLSGWMEDTNDPDSERFYSYVAKKQ